MIKKRQKTEIRRDGGIQDRINQQGATISLMPLSPVI